MKKTKGPTVVKSNKLIEAKYRLSLNEQRVLLNYISQIDSLKPLSDQDRFTIHVSDFAKQFDMDESNAYHCIKEMADTLFERALTITDETMEKGYIKTRWISSYAHYAEGKITIRWAQDILPYLSSLKKNFTSYKLEYIAKMTSVHAVRIYELLIQWGEKGIREIKIADLRDFLAIKSTEYKRLHHFKDRVLKTAVNQINSFSDIEVKWSQKKQGRKVSHIIFKYNYKSHLKRKVSTQKTNKELAKITKILDQSAEVVPNSHPNKKQNSLPTFTLD